jgi:hypothetical protein
MKMSLNKLIEKYHDKLNYLGTSYNNKHKQFVQIENEDFAKTLIMHYDNLKLIRTTSQFAPEIHKYFITLK